MSTHTPGPWVDAKATDKTGGSIVMRGDEWIAVAQDFNQWDRDAERQANARLIAAAPDLLAALQKLADYAEAEARGGDEAVPQHLRCINSGMVAQAVSEARAAIAKAEGKS